MSPDNPTILDTAKSLVYGDRNDDYGPPYLEFARTAKMWSAILGVEVSPAHVPLCMIALKLSRQVHKPKLDNLVDIAGYAATIEKTGKEVYTVEDQASQNHGLDYSFTREEDQASQDELDIDPLERYRRK